MSELIAPGERDVEKLHTAIDDIVSMDPQRFSQISAPDVTIRIDESEKVIGQIAESFRRVREVAIDGLPDHAIGILAHAIHITQNALSQVESLDASSYSSQDFRNQVMNVLNHAHLNVFDKLVPILAHASPDSTDVIDLQKSTEQVTRHIKEMSSKVDKYSDEAQVALAKIRGAAAEAGVSQHGTIFSDNADEHGKLKNRWIVVSIIIAAVTIAIAILTMVDGHSYSNTGELISYLSGRLFLFGVLSYALVWSGRMYRAQAHNEIVNKHRQNALQTFDTFTAASSDKATKNAILTQATMCIFSHRPSGFGQDDSDLPPRSHLLELTRNVTTDDSKST